MEVKVFLRNLRTAPRKVRQVADLIRGKKVADARGLLEFTVKRSAEPFLNLLNSAVASAVHDFQMEESNLYLEKVMVDEGPKLKRSHPMSRGRAYPILKRTSHIMIVVAELKSKTPAMAEKGTVIAKEEKTGMKSAKKETAKPKKVSTNVKKKPSTK